MCLDSGVYMANLKSCCLCQSIQVSVLNKTVSEDGGIEVIVFERKSVGQQILLGSIGFLN